MAGPTALSPTCFHSSLCRALVCPDDSRQAVLEGECQRLDSHDIGPDFLLVIKNEKQFLEYQNRLTVFDSTGWSFEAPVVLKLLFRHARALGLGEEIKLESVSIDPLNPFEFLKEASAGNAVKLLVIDK